MTLRAVKRNGQSLVLSREYANEAEAVEAATSKALTGSLSIGEDVYLFTDAGGSVRYADIDHFETEENDG